MSIALLFPGQAAQFVGMTAKEVDLSPQAVEILHLVDETLGYKLSDIMLNGPEEKLKQTIHTQPAVYVHSYLMLERYRQDHQITAVAGHSLGEISACVAAGVLDFESGLRLVQERAEAMQEACEKNPSTMAAILGMEDESVIDICANINQVVVPANFNCPGQLVISGSHEGIAEAIRQCKEAGAKRALEIPVGGAFHSPLMEPALVRFKSYIDKIEFQDAAIPVYQNVDASPHKTAATIKSNLVSQVTSPVRWTDSIRQMMDDGHTEYAEVGGKGKVLMGMLRKISRDANVALWSEV
ncbi:MAG: ACP S-malonyltransferase [Bacteroidota bacterium]